MKHDAILYVPSDTPEAMTLASRRVAGVPLAIRGMMTLAEAGIRRITVLIAPSQEATLKKFLVRFAGRDLPEITFLPYDEPYRMSPELVHRLIDTMNHRFLLLNANLLFDKGLIETIRRLGVQGKEILFCQQNIQTIPCVELTHTALRSLIPFTTHTPRSIESCLRHLFETMQPSVIQKPVHIGTFLVTRPEDVPIAEKFLAEGIRRSTKGPIARYLNKRFSLPVSLILSKLWISPNTITACNICVGLSASIFVADGRQYWAVLLGAFLYQLASIADGCDGEVAKFTFRSSKFGQYIDTISDNLSLLALMVAMMIGWWRASASPAVFVLGGVMLLGAVVSLSVMGLTLARYTTSASLVAYETEFVAKLSRPYHPWLLGFIRWMKYSIKKDLFSFGVFCCALVGQLHLWFLLTALGSVVTASIVTYLYVCEASSRKATLRPLSDTFERTRA